MNEVENLSMTEVDDLLSKYSLTRDNATAYIDCIVRMNQTQTAEETSVSRDTVNRYKKAFGAMNSVERAKLISSLTQEKLLEQASER